MPIRQKYTVRCITEAPEGELYLVVETWSATVPTTCPNDSGHTIGAVHVINRNNPPKCPGLCVPHAGLIVSTIDDECCNYNSIANAFSDGNADVYVRNGTYTESSDIIIPTGGKLIGESLGVIITLSSGASVKVDGSAGVKETAGTISVTNGSATVTGSGTTFTNLSSNQFILIDYTYHEIGSITNDTSLELVNIYRGVTKSGFVYQAQNMSSCVSIENIIINGSSGTGLSLRATRIANVKNVIVSGNGTNVSVVDCGDCTLDVVNAQNSTVGPGVLIQDSNDITFSSCTMTNNTTHGVHMDSTSNHVTISECSVTNNNTGIECSNDIGSIKGCFISSSVTNGINLSGNSNLVEGCTVLLNGGVGIYITGEDNITSNNRVKTNTGNGVELTAAAVNNLVTTNSIIGNTGVNFVDNGTGTISSSNIVS